MVAFFPSSDPSVARFCISRSWCKRGGNAQSKGTHASIRSVSIPPDTSGTAFPPHTNPPLSFHSPHFKSRLLQFLRRRNASQSTLSPYFCPSLMTFSHFHRLQFTKRWPTSGPKWRPAEVVCLPAMSNERLPCVRCTSRRCAFQHIKKCLRRKKRALVLDKNIACIDLLSPETSHFISMQRL